MEPKGKSFKAISEFRKDLVSGDWILVASRRSKRPQVHIAKEIVLPAIEKNCPFDNPQASGNPAPLLWIAHPTKRSKKIDSTLKDWWVQIVPNKYPALTPFDRCPGQTAEGPYYIMKGVGFHEVIITKDHRRRISEMTQEEVETVLDAYLERYRILAREPCIEYILIFHNQGSHAGATILHPHSQLIALPIIPPDVIRSLEGSRLYYTQNGKCVHCSMLDWERKAKIRVIYENKKFVVIEPFAPRVSFETRIFPKVHSANFDKMSESDRRELADALRSALKKIKKGIGDPDYNFFIHTAPAKAVIADYYHWHMEILPHTEIWAGLELGTGIEVVAISPEESASTLRRA